LVDLGQWKWPVFGLLAVTAVLLVLMPVVTGAMTGLMTRFGYFSLPQVWTLEHWRIALGDSTFLRALRNSVLAGLATSLLGRFLFSIVANVIARTRLPGRALLDGMAWLPQAVPGVMLGLMPWLFVGTPLLGPIYNSLWMLVLAFLLSHMPVGVQLS